MAKMEAFACTMTQQCPSVIVRDARFEQGTEVYGSNNEPRDVYPPDVMILNPLGPLIHTLKQFCIWFRFHKYITVAWANKFRSVIDNAEQEFAQNFIWFKAVCLSWPPKWYWGKMYREKIAIPELKQIIFKKLSYFKTIFLLRCVIGTVQSVK